MGAQEKKTISRRNFIKTSVMSGGGLLLAFYVPEVWAGVVNSEPWTDPAPGNEINAWLSIDPDGIVTVRVPHTEMGQGALTSVSMLIAEELNVPWNNVRAVFASANRKIGRAHV